MCANKLRSHCIRTSKAIFQLLLSWKTFRYPAPIGHLLSPYPATTRRSARRSAFYFLRRSSSLFLRGLASGANFLFYIFLNGRIAVCQNSAFAMLSITVQFGAPMVSGNYCVTGLLRILHSTVLYLALKKLSFGWKVLRYTVYLPTLYSALR